MKPRPNPYPFQPERTKTMMVLEVAVAGCGLDPRLVERVENCASPTKGGRRIAVSRRPLHPARR
jgi:hypothetical protein